MVKRMLIDATHPEETRVVVLNGNRLEEFDFESASRKQLKGNIYLAKVTRVEPSLQAAFVDYGGNRHGFLAFNEIHPDYYRIPIADREALLAEARAAEREREAAQDAEDADLEAAAEAAAEEPDAAADALDEPVAVGGDDAPPHESAPDEPTEPASSEPPVVSDAAPIEVAPAGLTVETTDAAAGEPSHDDGEPAGDDGEDAAPRAQPAGNGSAVVVDTSNGSEGEPLEVLGGDALEEVAPRRHRNFRNYKIQEVIARRQIMLVQVVKEERGTKGAALTTYLSLAGRYCVLMPNTPRGGGVSRKITSVADRKRLKGMLDELEIPEGMAVIVRTAGMERSKAEIKRDYEYLLRLWDEIRALTLESTAPALIHEEGNLVKRSIRDLYARDIDEVLVDGEEGYKGAKAFMKTIVPSHAKRVQAYRDPQVPLFHRYQIESQLDAIHNPTVQLRSGGYIVINQTEALVAIDVNSGRATRERHIEETALKTNLEAADEIARQVRLRDLAGLVVIDFIDMEENRNNHAVERRLKEAMKHDRARIQIGRISAFGLLELSRQRLRPSLAETSTERCPHCNGLGLVRSTESTALHVLRAIEEEGIRLRSAEIQVHVPAAIALYILNQKRAKLAEIETRYGFHVLIGRDDTLVPPNYRLERLRQRAPGDPLPTLTAPPPPVEEADDDEVEMLDVAEADDERAAEGAEREPEYADRGEHDGERGEGGRRKRRRGRRKRHRGDDGAPRRDEPRFAPDDESRAARDDEPRFAGGNDARFPERDDEPFAAERGPIEDDGDAEMPAAHAPREAGFSAGDDGEGRKRRRRGRRGGRRRARRPSEEGFAPAPRDDGNGQAYRAYEPDPYGPAERDDDPAPAVHEAPERAPEPSVSYAPVRDERPPQLPLEQPTAYAAPAPRPERLPEPLPQPLPERLPEPLPAAPSASRFEHAAAAEAPSEPPRAPARPPEGVDVIVVEQPPDNPRKGWWRRLSR